MKIVHLNNNDIGGAGIAAARLHSQLLKMGVDSRFLTKQKHRTTISHHQQVKPVYYFMNDVMVRSGLKKDRILELTKHHLANRPPGYEHFSFPISDYDLSGLNQVTDADLIHLHWVSDGFLDFRSFFRKIKKPVVWTLHDMNPFTGGCHHSDGCRGFETNCTKCPQLFGTIDDDYAAKMLALKIEGLAEFEPGRLKIIAPSQWLLDCSRSSVLFGKVEHKRIRNVSDTDGFFPLDRDACRDELGLPLNKRILLYIVKDVTNPRKGYRHIQEMMKGMPDDVMLCTAGTMDVQTGSNTKNFGYVQDKELLNRICNAADVFVLPSLAENFPNTVCESLLCGVPVAGFNVGGMPELINSANGRLAEINNTGSLVRAVENILSHPEAFVKSAIAAAALKELDPVTITEQHLKVYRSFA